MDVDELLREHDLVGEDRPSQILRWSDKELEGFLSSADAFVREASLDAASTLRAAGPALVLYPEYRFKESQSLLKRCLLYADWVVLPVAFPAFQSQLAPYGLRRQTVTAVESLQALRPFIRTGVFLPMSALAPAPPGKSDQDPLIDSLLDRNEISELVSDRSEIGLRSEQAVATHADGVRTPVEVQRIHAGFDGQYVAATRAHVPGSDTQESDGERRVTITILPIRGQMRVPSAKELRENEDLRDALDRAVRFRVGGLLQDWSLACGLYDATLVTGSPTGWEIVHAIEAQARQGGQYPTERALVELDLPFLDNVPVELIAEERHRAQDHLGAFRAALDNLSVEAGKALASEASESELRAIRDKHINEPLRELDARLRELNMQRWTELVGSAVLMGASASLALYSGVPPAVAIASGIVSAAGGKKFVESLAQLLKERAALARSSVHLLWRVKRRGQE